MEFCEVISLLLTHVLQTSVLQVATSAYTKQPQMLPHRILTYIFVKKNKTIAIRETSVLIGGQWSKVTSYP